MLGPSALLAFRVYGHASTRDYADTTDADTTYADTIYANTTAAATTGV